jgi:hypothetical protein
VVWEFAAGVNKADDAMSIAKATVRMNPLP